MENDVRKRSRRRRRDRLSRIRKKRGEVRRFDLMREKVLYLFYSRSCSLVEKALFVDVLLFTRACVCAGC